MTNRSVVVFGDGETAESLSHQFQTAGIGVVFVSPSPKELSSTIAGYGGRIVVTANREVTVLDPATGDERRVIRCGALVLTSVPSADTGLAVGTSKLGVKRGPDGRFVVDESGKTTAGWIFAVGEAAAGPLAIREQELVRAVQAALTGTQN